MVLPLVGRRHARPRGLLATLLVLRPTNNGEWQPLFRSPKSSRLAPPSHHSRSALHQKLSQNRPMAAALLFAITSHR